MIFQVYSGSVKLTDKVEGVPVDAGKLVLSATRTYAPIIKKLLDTVDKKNIHGIIHCSVRQSTRSEPVILAISGFIF